ncbi:MAG: NAD(P)H-binding protein [Pseudomonadota bacterium]
MPSKSEPSNPSKRVFLLGATGTIGRATLKALMDEGHHVVAFGRRAVEGNIGAVEFRLGSVAEVSSILNHGLRGENFDAIISCLASRTGAPADAWAIDHQAHVNVLEAAKAAGIPHMVLLSAICVQKSKLAFQHAKLAFETALIASGLTYSIVRPTAYFKSLSGQVKRVKEGKPFLVFGDGQLTACKPISDRDLAAFMVSCLSDPQRQNIVLPIGGPGPAITPREQGDYLFTKLGMEPRFRNVPIGMMDAIIGTLSMLGKVSPKLAEKAELARIGRYYATESMLVLNSATGKYDADATPSFGSDTLFEFYDRVLEDPTLVDLGDHAVF